MTKLAICGPGGAGKDEAANWLRDHTPLRYHSSTSEMAASIVFSETGRQYQSVKACWDDRRNHRELWAEIIATWNSTDPTRLYRDTLKDQDILVGMRWPHEAAACWQAELVDLWIWIDNPRAPVDPSMRFGKEACDVIIENHGTLDEFYGKLEALAKAMGILRLE